MKKLFVLSLIILFALSLMPATTQAVHSDSGSTALKAGSLIKASKGSVYYYGADGKRYVFPNEKTYKTWFVSFDMIITVSDNVLSSVPIGGNVTYKPGKKLVKIQTDPKVYYVDKNGTLRHVTSEDIAQKLYGGDWMYMVEDIPDAFFTNYTVGSPMNTTTAPQIAYDYSINQDKNLSDQPDPDSSQLGSIELSGAAIDATTAKLSWTVNNFYSEKGFKVVMSNQPDPVYPGNDFHYLTDPNIRSDKWYDLYQSGTYYFRVCEYLGGSCGVYSNNVAITISGSANTDNSNGSISLNGSWSSEKNKVALQWKPIDLYSAKGFKVVYSSNPNPVYPGNTYHYLSDPNARSDTWSGLPAGTYHFRVCEYLGGACGIYSNDITVTVPGTTIDNSNGTITLSGYYDQSLGKVRLEWTVGSLYSDKGFKVVESTQAYPVYPGNDYHYLSSPDARSDKWVGLPSGTHHFRVCEYLGGACGVYSNDLTVTIP